MNEEKIADFFAAHNRDISDRGFSQRVMRRVSKRSRLFQTQVIFAIIALTAIVAISAYIITIPSVDFGLAGIPYLSIGIVAAGLLSSSLLVADVSSKEI